MAWNVPSTCIEQLVPHLVPVQFPVCRVLQTLGSYDKIIPVFEVLFQSLSNKRGLTGLELFSDRIQCICEAI